jgi:hypothetical protein
MNDGKITPAKLQACVPYECSRGRFFQLPFISIFETVLDNTVASGFGTGFLFVPGNEQGAPPKYDFLIHALSALVGLPYTYMRVQWPDGHYLSNVPVDIWSMMRTGRNGRLLTKPKFIERGSVIRMELGTQQITAPVGVKVHYEGCILVPE